MTKRTCSECRHLASGRFVDPNPHHAKKHEVYGCAIRERFIGVHAHTGACLSFVDARTLGTEDEWHH